jgi:hypothetical protein
MIFNLTFIQNNHFGTAIDLLLYTNSYIFIINLKLNIY